MIHVEFKDFDEMVDFARQLLGQSAAQKEATAASAGQRAAVQSQPVPVATAPTATAPIQQTPAAQAAPVGQAQQPQPVPTATVPTTAQTYTPDDLARAAVALIDSGQQPALIGLLSQFGVSSLPELKPEQFGAFATALRGMGAQI